MTPDQIEAERVRFEAWYRKIWGNPGRRHESGYRHQNSHNVWSGWLARAEEQYASESAAELKEIGIEFIPLDKKRDEFNRLVDECRREENGE